MSKSYFGNFFKEKETKRKLETLQNNMASGNIEVQQQELAWPIQWKMILGREKILETTFKGLVPSQEYNFFHRTIVKRKEEDSINNILSNTQYDLVPD